MRHDRSIELTPGSNTYFDYETLSALPECYVLVARCQACGHQTELDRKEVGWRFGKNVELSSLAARLRCRSPCGNRIGNRLFLWKLPR